MAKKTYKITIGTNNRFVRLDDKYTALASVTGIELAVAGDMKQGDYTEKIESLVNGGVLYQISAGLEVGKRKVIFVAADSLQKYNELIDLKWGDKTIKSASPRRYTKLSA